MFHDVVCLRWAFCCSRLALIAFLAVGLSIASGQCHAQTSSPPASAAPATIKKFKFDDEHRDSIKQVQKFVGHTGPVNVVQFVTDGKRIASCSDDGTLRIWQLSDGRELTSVKGVEGKLKSLIILGGALHTYVASANKKIYVCDLDRGVVTRTIAGGPNPVQRMGADQKETLLYAIDDAGNAYTWDLTAADPQAIPMPTHPDATARLRQIRLDETHNRLWASGDFPYLVCWNWNDRQPAGKLQFAGRFEDPKFAFSHDGKYAIVANGREFCTAVRNDESNDYDTHNRTVHTSGLANIERVLPVGADYFALLGGDGAIEFWRSKDEQFGGQYPAAAADVSYVTYARAANLVLTGHTDGSITSWSVDAVRERPESEVGSDAAENEKWFRGKQFDKLAQRVDEYRKSHASWGTGQSKLHCFYLNLNSPEDND